MNFLPIEILESILRYLPAKDIESFKLVCNDFYKAEALFSSFKKPLKINIPKLIDCSIYNSMTNSYRQFKELQLDLAGINDWTILRLAKVLCQIGDKITSLHVSQYPEETPLKLSNLIKILENLKNLKSITNHMEYQIDHDLSLPQLKDISLSHASMGIIAIADKLKFLPALELTLNESWFPPKSSDNFEPEWFLENVKFVRMFEVDKTVFRNIRIRKLSYHDANNTLREEENSKLNKFLSDLLKTQNHIEELDFYSFFCAPNLLCKIGRMISLRKLSMKIDEDVEPDEICNLGNLKLEDLRIDMIYDYDAKVMEKFIEIPFHCLKVLNVECFWPKIDERILLQRMSANWQKLQTLNVYIYEESTLTLGAILDSLPQLECLNLTVFSGNMQFQYGYYGKCYPALSKFEYWSFGSDNELTMTSEFIKAFPNLTSLHLYLIPSINVNLATLQAIFDSQIQNLSMEIVIQRNDEIEIIQLIERIYVKIKQRGFSITVR